MIISLTTWYTGMGKLGKQYKNHEKKRKQRNFNAKPGRPSKRMKAVQ